MYPWICTRLVYDFFWAPITYLAITEHIQTCLVAMQVKWDRGGESVGGSPGDVSDNELILQAFSHFTYVTAHSDSPSFPSLHLRHKSFSNPSVALPTSFSNLSVASLTSQVILQPFRRFIYCSFSNLSVASPTSQVILQPFRRFTYCSFSNLSVASLTSQVILQPFFTFSYVTSTSLNLPWRAVHVVLQFRKKPSTKNLW